jgi:MFS family permease
MTIGLTGGAIFSFLLVFANSVPYVGVTRFFFGLFLAAIAPSATAVLAKNVPNKFRSRILSINSSVSQIGSAAGPMIGGAVAGFWSLNSVFALTGIGLVGIMIWMRSLTLELPEPIDFESHVTSNELVIETK